MSPVLIRKMKLLAVMCAFMAGVGVLYQLVGPDPLGISSVIVGGLLGLSFGVMELFALEAWGRRLHSLAFGPLILAKATIYTLVVFTTSHTIGFLEGLFTGKELHEFWVSLVDGENWALLLVTLASYGMMAFFVQMNRMVGQDVLMKFLRGRYLRATEEDRVFMFLDLKGSTTIAERLGATYYQLLNDFFHDISHPVMTARAEIYQYVGDEVVLTWEIDRGLQDANCIRVYTLIDDAVAARAEEYRRKYGVVPEYKAGLHCGRVISAQIGDIKREIVYNGDVVNTTSRIQEQCGELGVDLLVSGDLMGLLDLPEAYAAEELGPTELKGKERQVELFAIGRRAG
ncbi:adenylate/guanylate cyclase domain-containing protein [Candidatus Poribacteria bacterium]|nr:adenylate/guanylate cyclase domain-containing protein [Candidatus Poribacteria bacterium]MBT5532848.1 adenylate/guanylate cyclase domain-containing protein [Candidatus Poribacteria bacterium]MBT5713665.1 adenylate/guanylate cyclase domain-containing protein [Candidatus Poribacteria bacterium]MBT7098431.1 adenylate/guanylate cyclase domain-containing protein [Candidatus Poribacteria bacterium]MBT7805414.1 adenylate/guanylate cyclase domain-containing protein [Candidatus Poribacteria bacterium